MVVLLFITGCKEPDKGPVDIDTQTEAIMMCERLCDVFSGDLRKGPCISNNVIPNWACDVVHQPRTEDDNLSENQCRSIADGMVDNLIEINPNCEFIRVAK